MSCYAQWIVFAGSAVAFGVGDAAAEVFSGGGATPAVIAAALAEITALLGEGLEIYNCYQEQGDQESAAAIKAKLDALQQEMDQLKAAGAQ